MEQFVRMLVAGGVALVVGLWILSLFGVGSVPWLAGVALAVVGVGGLTGGIWREVDY